MQFLYAGGPSSSVFCWSSSRSAATDGSAVLTDQFVLLDEAAKLPSRNQLAPLSQDQLRGEEHVANEDTWTSPQANYRALRALDPLVWTRARTLLAVQEPFGLN